jgi:hypothetical protein
MVEMFVELVVPDNTAITAKNTLHKLGHSVEDLHRFDYYNYEGDDLSKVDILVNVNKHKVSNEKAEGVNVLVIDDGDNGLVEELGKLGLKVSKIQKGVVWCFKGCSEKEAISMVKDLLINDNYQEFVVL